MKKLQFIFAVLAMTSLFLQCSKSDTPAVYKCTTCKTTPDAIATNDASTKGIYKGVIIGSSGTITFDIANNGSTITAKMVIDGVSATLTSDVAWVDGQPYVGAFKGMLSGQDVTINFSVGLSGAEPTITSSTIPGHPNATLTVYKETSTNLVECFEGSYSTTKPETGTFNIILSRSLGLWGGVSRTTGSSSSSSINGAITNNQLFSQDLNNGTTPVATLSNDQLTGSFADGQGTTVTVTGKRTL